MHWGPFERKIYDPVVHGVTIDGSPKIYSRHTGGGEWSAGCTQHLRLPEESSNQAYSSCFYQRSDKFEMIFSINEQTNLTLLL